METVEETMRAYAIAQPDGPSSLRPGRITRQAVERFAEWFVSTGRGDERAAGEMLHAAMWPQRGC
jgi:hypothetical protein